MRAFVLLSILALARSALGQAIPGTPAANQLELFKNSTAGPVGKLTTTYGVPVTETEANQSINSDLLFNPHFVEEITHFNRERIPQRVVHGKGTGAFGYFEVTHDITNISNAALFEGIGKITPLVVRFSSAFSDRGSPDQVRGPFGMAIKFYTEEGNWDFLGFTTDTFTVKDPGLFPSALHMFFANPRTSIVDSNARIDFLLARPEALSIVSQFFGDMGIPAGYRYIAGFPIHTFQVENDKQEISFVRFKMTPDLGEKYLNSNIATIMAGSRPDLYTEDLYNAIGNGDYPTWTLGVQVIAEKDVQSVPFDIFDITLRWPYDKYPLQTIGKMTLNKNPENHFATIEQAAFCPGNVVPGIQGVDKTFEARSFAYRDAQLYRLGVNFNKIAVNCPLRPAYTYTRDGAAPVGTNGGEAPNYWPNTYHGPVPINQTRTRTKRVTVYTDPNPTNLNQTLEYIYALPEERRNRLVLNLATILLTTYPSTQQKALDFFGQLDPNIRLALEAAMVAAQPTLEALATPPPTI